MCPAPADLAREIKPLASGSSSNLLSSNSSKIYNSNFHADKGNGANGRDNSEMGNATECYAALQIATDVLPDATKGLVNDLLDMGISDTQVPNIIDLLADYGLLRKLKRNLTAEIREWLNVASGSISVANCYKEAGLVTIGSMAQARVIFRRLKNEGIIEKVGEKAGFYRLVDTECEDIDWKNACTDGFNIRLPFHIEELVKILPKNVIIVAGEQNAGKTAFLLNTLKMNMRDHNCWYFSSEMGEVEFNERLSLFDDVRLQDWNFHAKERSSNFPDVTRPDAVNFIDYLEIHDEFWKVGGILKGIYDKLNKGIAVIGLQKPKGRGRGTGRNGRA